MELAAGGIEGALLFLGCAVGDQGSAVRIERAKHHLIHRLVAQPRTIGVFHYRRCGRDSPPPAHGSASPMRTKPAGPRGDGSAQRDGGGLSPPSRGSVPKVPLVKV
jgi:hypothetical protein